MTADEIRAAEFPRVARGYPRLLVRAELAQIADLREKGFAPSSYGVRVSRLSRRGYDPEAVDRFFAVLARYAPPELRVVPERPEGGGGEGKRRRRRLTAEAEWRRVADLPGARVLVAGGQVIGSAGEVLLTDRRAPRPYTGDTLAAPPVTVNTLNLATGQVLRVDKDDVGGGSYEGTGWQVTDLRTGEPLLWTRGMHFFGKALGYTLLPGKRYFLFPVTGTRPRNAVMTAVADNGDTVLWFRRIARAKYEIIVRPDFDLTTELICIVSLAAGWLDSYFDAPGN